MSSYEFTEENGLIIRTGFYFKKIWIIESIPDGEFSTGKELRDALYSLIAQNPNLDIELVEIGDSNDFFLSIKRIKDDFLRSGSIPLLHFETHGCKQGLQLKNNDFVSYEDMLPVLRELNILTQHNLFTAVAACHGGYFAFILRNSLTEPCPFWGVCGPEQVINAPDLLAGYSAFYKGLLSSNINNALVELKHAIPQSANSFHVFNSEYLFILAFKNYLTVHCTEAETNKRIEAMKQTEGELSKEQIEYLKTCMISTEGQKSSFEMLKNKFFLHNKFPDKKDLPNPSFEDMNRIKDI